LGSQASQNEQEALGLRKKLMELQKLPKSGSFFVCYQIKPRRI